MSFKLLSSPLQGFTDFRFRNAFHKYFGGIDTFYAPYIRLQGKLKIKSSYELDLIPENNHVPEIIPQVITNDANEFVFVTKYVQSLGYKELNWNLGCPYPMVAKSGMGSGLICNTQRINEVLEKVHSETDIVVSMKMRMGYDHPSEILETFKILDNYPIKNIAIHARIGKQLYKGGVDLDAFEKCLSGTKHKLYYNGDITDLESFKNYQNRFKDIDHWMIGRGLIANPFLPSMIKANQNEKPVNWLETFKSFHDEIFEAYDEYLQGPTPIKMKMRSFWEYFSQMFDNPHKTYKKIKKANNYVAYQKAIADIFDEG